MFASLHADIDSKIAEYHTSEGMRPVTSAVIQGVGEAIIDRLYAKLKSEFEKRDLRINGLLQGIERLERNLGGDRSDVIDLPMLPRSQRRG
jgi:hypothetical protein